MALRWDSREVGRLGQARAVLASLDKLSYLLECRRGHVSPGWMVWGPGLGRSPLEYVGGLRFLSFKGRLSYIG